MSVGFIFTYPSGKAPIENIWSEEPNTTNKQSLEDHWTNLWSVTFKADKPYLLLAVEPIGDSLRLPLDVWGDTRCTSPPHCESLSFLDFFCEQLVAVASCFRHN